MPKTLLPGTISHGTLRPEDVIPALIHAFELVSSSEPKATAFYTRFLAATGELDGEQWEMSEEDAQDELSNLWDELVDALQEYAPEGFYVGAHMGDGSDIGVWQDE